MGYGPQQMQIGRHCGAGRKARRYMKKITNKAQRLAAKKDPENAPTKRRYFYWWD